MFFYGGYHSLETMKGSAIGGGLGGRGYLFRERCGNNGTNGSSATVTVFGSPVMETYGAHYDLYLIRVDGYNGQQYFSVAYSPSDNGEHTGSTLSEGNIWIIVAVAVIVIGGVAALVIVKKKQSEAIHNS